ncbi:hypothetical protein ACFQ3Z_21440 [Streptomyces nogalater]
MTSSDSGPHQPRTRVSRCIRRNTASAQVRHSVPRLRRNRMTTTMPW